MERALVDGYAQAAEAWPTIEFGSVDLVTDVGRRLREPVSPSELPWADLYLAAACARASEPALRAFEVAMFPEIPRLLGKHRCSVERNELEQHLRHWLFIREAPGEPRIASYVGRGRLRNWFRVTALRQALNLSRAAHARREDATMVGVLEKLAPVLSGPELEPYKRRYLGALRESFTKAVDDLDPQERLVLRFQLVDGLTVDQIGRAFDIHRSSAARRLASARTNLLLEIRKRMAETLDMEDADVDAVVLMVVSRVELTLSRVL